MDKKIRALQAELGRMSSIQAADWLMNTFPVDNPDYGVAIALLPHRSWKRSDQVRLARHYLKKMPFASSKIYEAFASFMSIELLLNLIKKFIPAEKSDVNLLLYHLVPTLEKHAKTEGDRERIKSFVADLNNA